MAITYSGLLKMAGMIFPGNGYYSPKGGDDGDRQANTQDNSGSSQASGGGTGTYVTVTFPLTVTDPGPFPPPHEGIRAGEIVAWRGWIVREEGYALRSPAIYNYDSNEVVAYTPPRLLPLRLTSLVAAVDWEPGVPMEGDINGKTSDSLPIRTGVFALKDGASLHDYMRSYEFHGPGDPIYALGTVELWGEVDEHADGYRASFAAIRSIDALFGRYFTDSVSAFYAPFNSAERIRDRQAMLRRLREMYGCP